VSATPEVERAPGSTNERGETVYRKRCPGDEIRQISASHAAGRVPPGTRCCILGSVKRHHLSAAKVEELAELLEEAPQRVGVVDDVLQAAAEGRGMTLRLNEPERRGGHSPHRSPGKDRSTG